jgi:hypothetical protein
MRLRNKLFIALASLSVLASGYSGHRIHTQNQKQQQYVAFQAIVESHDVYQVGGTRIERNSQGAMYRDGQGRTRIETTIDYNGGSFKVITIKDPVAKVAYVLNEKDKTAKKFDLTKIENTAQEVLQQQGLAGKGYSPNIQAQEQEYLGTRVIDGYVTEGKRIVVRLAEHPPLNRPIVMTIETWTARQLDVPVLTHTMSSAGSDKTSRLKNIQFNVQPDPGLFQVPPDYTVIMMSRPSALGVTSLKRK